MIWINLFLFPKWPIWILAFHCHLTKRCYRMWFRRLRIGQLCMVPQWDPKILFPKIHLQYVHHFIHFKFHFFQKVIFLLFHSSLHHLFWRQHCFRVMNLKKQFDCNQFWMNWCIGLHTIPNLCVKHWQIRSKWMNSLKICSTFLNVLSKKVAQLRYSPLPLIVF